MLRHLAIRFRPPFNLVIERGRATFTRTVADEDVIDTLSKLMRHLLSNHAGVERTRVVEGRVRRRNQSAQFYFVPVQFTDSSAGRTPSAWSDPP